MNENEVIAKHGWNAVTALFKEFAQLHDKQVFKSIKASDLTYEQKNNALHAINLIKDKRNGILKGRTVADGRIQRQWYSKNEITSLTVSNDSLMVLWIVSASERRKLFSWDVVGAYSLADQDDDVLVKFTGESANVLFDVDPLFRGREKIEHVAEHRSFREPRSTATHHSSARHWCTPSTLPPQDFIRHLSLHRSPVAWWIPHMKTRAGCGRSDELFHQRRPRHWLMTCSPRTHSPRCQGVGVAPELFF